MHSFEIPPLALQIIEEKMDIKGGFAKPTYRDMLWVQLVFLPYTLWTWTYFYTRWLWKFGIKREEYGEEEKVYVIRRNMGLSQLQFDAQVWTHSLKSNSVDFSKSRIGVKKCVFNQRTIKVCVSCFCWCSETSAAQLTVSLFLCLFLCNAQGKPRALEGRCVAQKALRGSETETRDGGRN